ncbi:MAG: SRPBCC family protein [Solirubrobacteraceae bacterium]
MRMHVLEREQRLPEPPETVFRFFGEARNLERITPPLLCFRVLTPDPIEMAPGTLIDYRLKLRGVPLRWRTEIREWLPPHRFVDVQLRGPYRVWHHTHTFAADGNGGTLMRDTVRYALPPGGGLVRGLIERDLRAIFDYRAASASKIRFAPGKSPGESA